MRFHAWLWRHSVRLTHFPLMKKLLLTFLAIGMWIKKLMGGRKQA